MIRTIHAVRSIACAALLAASLAPALARADDAAAPPAGLRADMIANIADAGGKLQELAGAVPEDKYGWAPAKGVRTAGEVYLHVVAANYMLPGMAGVAGGMSMEEGMKLDKTPQTKAKTLEMLKESYAFLSLAIAGMSDADMDAQVNFFGNKMSKRAVLLAALGHTHEHLGQAIAYARAMGITPPWTARQEAAAKKPAAQK